MRLSRLLGLSLIGGACLSAGPTAARSLSVVDLLDRYAGGQFETVVEELARVTNFDDLLRQLKRDAPAWLDTKGPGDRERRELVAATFALEAARADEWHEWVWIQRQPEKAAPPMAGAPVTVPGGYQPLNVLSWKPPPLLIEWGCELMRKDEVPRPIERWWQLAALAVAQRSEDPKFLVGDTAIGRGVGAGEIIDTQDEIKHLDHVMKRFPAERRFALAQGIARDRDWQDDALVAYTAVLDDPDVGGEASMRLGAMQMRQNRASDAMRHLERAETLTRDRYVIYLARYFKGRILQRQDRLDRAESEYRGAVAAWPHGQAATMALSAVLFRDGRRAEAHERVGRMLSVGAHPFDPWREYVHADNRFWPQLIGRLRAEINK
jgi:Flp pilus assembly protein TadD